MKIETIEASEDNDGQGFGGLLRTPPTCAVAMPPHPARGVAKIHIGPHGQARIPDGPPVQEPLNIGELEKNLTGLRELI